MAKRKIIIKKNTQLNLFEENRIENPEDKLYHNGAFLKNKKEQKELLWL